MIFKGFLSHSNIVLDSPIGILCGVHIVLHTLELLTMKEAKKGPNVYIYIIIYIPIEPPNKIKITARFPFVKNIFRCRCWNQGNTHQERSVACRFDQSG